MAEKVARAAVVPVACLMVPIVHKAGQALTEPLSLLVGVQREAGKAQETLETTECRKTALVATKSEVNG
jgi:hypothetical protein